MACLRTLLLGLCTLLVLSGVHAQEPVKGHLEEARGGRLQVVDVQPDSFPLVNLVLRAEDRTGTPLWGLRPEHVQVREDGTPCMVTCLYPITYPAPIRIALVIDHSGSMMYNDSYVLDSALQLRLMMDTNALRTYLDTMVSPLAHARNGVLGFISGFDNEKDAIGISAFSTTVDVQAPVTNDTAVLARLVRALVPTESTALYDAVLAGLHQLHSETGLRVVVVLTDGQDNSSTTRLEQVIERSIRDSIPIYAIGLGGANRQVLDSLAQGTGGRSYFTQDPKTLAAVYAEISRNIQAYYHLQYRSTNLASADTTRDVAVSLSFGDLALQSVDGWVLPAAVKAVLARAERERTWTWGAGVATLVVLGGVLTYRWRRKPRPLVSRLWPVPTSGPLFVELDAVGGIVLFNDVALTVRKQYRIANGMNQYDLSAFAAGPYVLTVTVPGKPPEVHRFVKE